MVAVDDKPEWTMRLQRLHKGAINSLGNVIGARVWMRSCGTARWSSENVPEALSPEYQRVSS